MERLPEFIANHLFLFSLLIAILAFLLWDIFGHVVNGVKLLLPDEMTRLINREDAKVIDLRSPTEFEKGHIIDAMNISIDELANKLDLLKHHKDNGIIFYCTNGTVSVKETKKLLNEGYKKVYCLKGGLYSWQSASLPLMKGS